MKLKLYFIHKTIYVLFALCIGSLLSSCSKDSTDAEAAEIARVKKMLDGKWSFVSYTKNHHYSDKDNVSMTSASPGDYVNFTSDDKLQLRLLGYDDLSTYSVLPNNKILFYGSDVFDIRTLTASQLELYRKDVISAKDYQEETYIFNK